MRSEAEFFDPRDDVLDLLRRRPPFHDDYHLTNYVPSGSSATWARTRTQAEVSSYQPDQPVKNCDGDEEIGFIREKWLVTTTQSKEAKHDDRHDKDRANLHDLSKAVARKNEQDEQESWQDQQFQAFFG
jgi:hypothetical protein